MTDLLIATCCLLQVVRNLDAKRKSLVEAGLKVDTFGLVVRCHSQGNWEHLRNSFFFSNFLHVDLNITFLFDTFFFRLWTQIYFNKLTVLFKYFTMQYCWPYWTCWIGAWMPWWPMPVGHLIIITIRCRTRHSPAPVKWSVAITPILTLTVKCFTYASRLTKMT